MRDEFKIPSRYRYWKVNGTNLSLHTRGGWLITVASFESEEDARAFKREVGDEARDCRKLHKVLREWRARREG